VLAIGAVVATFGCSDLASGSDRLEDPLGAKYPNWQCLDKAPPAFVLPDPAPPYVAYVAPIFDFANPPTAVKDLTVVACQISDSNCPPGSEVGQVVGPVPFPTVLEGASITVPLYTIVMPFGVSAYLRMTAPGYVRQEYIFGGPLIGTPGGKVTMLENGATAAVIAGLPLTLVREKDADSLANQIGLTRDPQRAILAVRTIDCSGVPAAGVTLTLDLAEGVAFSYLSNLALSPTNPPQPTDEKGLAGFANISLPNGVPLYTVTLEGLGPNGKKYGRRPFAIRPNQMTTGEIRPYPDEYGR
jgi:hypothetical protein